MEIDLQRFTQAVHERTGLDLEQAGAAVTTTFEAIGRALAPAAVASVAALLPDPLAESLRRGSTSAGVGDVLVDLAEQEQVSLGVAKEHAQVVLEQLAARMDESARARLAQLLPDELARWLEPWQPPPERHVRAPAGRERTLASGRPGGQAPLSEAAPDRGQHDSLAASTDPHADTRMSSAHGISTERSKTTIADGRPGSQHPIVESHD